MISPDDIATIDPGIRRTVVWLNQLGFQTTDSGDGVTKPAAGLGWDDGVRDHPHVVCVVPESSLIKLADKVMRRLVRLGIPVVPMGHPGGVWIQASYDPNGGAALIDVMHLHDGLLPSGLGT